jgi:hypothetical protein
VTEQDKGAQFPPDNPGESLFDKESREADEILARERARKKVAAKPKRESGK